MKILVLKKKNLDFRFILKLFLILFLLSLVIFSDSNIKAVQNALALFIEKVFPTLFPFFIATDLISHTNIIHILNEKMSNFMFPLFNVSGAGAFPLILGLLSGYPSGAKIIADFREKNICSKTDCERLLAYTNNSGPLFIIGTIGTSLFFSKKIGFLLLFIHILSAISVAFIFKFYKKNETRNYELTEELNLTNFSNIFSNSIINSLKTLSIIFGYIIFFAIIINVLLESNILNLFHADIIKGFILGFLELTNGINFISSIISVSLFTKLIVASFVLGFGGISVLLQVYSIISKTDISIKTYVVRKIIARFYFCYIYVDYLNTLSIITLKDFINIKN